MRPRREHNPAVRWFTHEERIAADYDIFLFGDPGSPNPDDGLVPVGDEVLRVSADEQTAVFFCRGPVATPHVRLEVFDSAPAPLVADWPERQEATLQITAGRRGLTTLMSGAHAFPVQCRGARELPAARRPRLAPERRLRAVRVLRRRPDPEYWIIQQWPSDDHEPRRVAMNTEGVTAWSSCVAATWKVIDDDIDTAIPEIEQAIERGYPTARGETTFLSASHAWPSAVHCAG